MGLPGISAELGRLSCDARQTYILQEVEVTAPQLRCGGGCHDTVDESYLNPAGTVTDTIAEALYLVVRAQGR